MKNYSCFSLERPDKAQIVIENAFKNGFDLALCDDGDEYKLYFSGWSKYFFKSSENEEEIIDLIAGALTGTVRIKEFYKRGRAFKWLLQKQSSDQVWITYHTTMIATLDFWAKITSAYLINSD